MEGIVLGRIGHYFDAGNGSCQTAVIVAVWADEYDDAPGVNLAGWQQDADDFKRFSVKVVAQPTIDDTENSFHLGGPACPFGK